MLFSGDLQPFETYGFNNSRSVENPARCRHGQTTDFLFCGAFGKIFPGTNILTHVCRMEFPILINWKCRFQMGLDARKSVFMVCEQQMRRPSCASAQSDQCLCYSLIGKYLIKTCYK